MPPSPAAGRLGGRWSRWGRLLAAVGLLAFIPFLVIRRAPLDPAYEGPAGAGLPELPNGPYRPARAFLEEREQQLGTRRYTLETFRVTAEDGPPGQRPLVLECYLPPGAGPHPVLLVMPILGGDYPVGRLFSRFFARQGFAAVLVHRRRGFGSFTQVEGLNRMLGEIVEDHQRAIDWIETRPLFDAGRIGCFGVSMGAMHGALVAAADPRVRAAVFGLGGGDLPFILARSLDPEVRRKRERLLEATGWSAAEYEARLREEVAWDPLLLAPRIDARRVLLVQALFDVTIPASSSRRLRRAMGGPRTIVLPAGHYSAAVFIPYIQWTVTRFFREQLDVSRSRADVRPLS